MASCKYNPGINSVNPYAVLNVTQASQNIASNKTVLQWELLLYRASVIKSTAPKAYSVVVDGKTVASSTTTIGGSGTKSIAKGTVDIPHNSDGTKSIKFSFSLTFEIKWNVGYIGTGKAEGNMTLSTIPRASSIESVSGAEIGKPITVNISRHAAFTHQIWYRIGTSDWVDCGKGHATSCTFTVSRDMCKYITEKESDILQLSIRTYSGNTQIGSDVFDNRYYINVPDDVYPSINSVKITEATSGIAAKIGAFVQLKSTLQISTNASGIYGSGIKGIHVYLNDNLIGSGSSIKSGILTNSGTYRIIVSVIDTRLREASYETTVEVLPYSPPYIGTFFVDRVNGQGKEDDDGTYAKIRINASISPLNNKNDKLFMIEYQEQGASSWIKFDEDSVYSVSGEILGGNILHQDKSYIFRITASDFFEEVTVYSNPVPTAFTLIDYNKSGRSIKFGGVSTRQEDEEAVDFGIDMFDKFGARINNGLARYTGSGGSAIDPDTTIEELILTDSKTPTGSMMYIRTMHYLGKDDAANRTQIAYPYSTDNSIYVRYFLNGSWGKWKKYMSSEDVGMFSVGLSQEGGTDTEYQYNGFVVLEEKALQDTTGGRIEMFYDMVKIGKGVKKIAISGQLFVQNKVNGYQWFSLCKSTKEEMEFGNAEYREIAQSIQTAGIHNYMTINFAEKIVDVSENDVFFIRKKEDKACLIRKLYDCSYLTLRIVQ